MLSETRSRGWLFNKRKSQEAHLIGLLRLSFSFPLVPLPYLWWSHKDFLIQLRLRRKNIPWIKILFINMLSLSHKAGKSPWNNKTVPEDRLFPQPLDILHPPLHRWLTLEIDNEAQQLSSHHRDWFTEEKCVVEASWDYVMRNYTILFHPQRFASCKNNEKSWNFFLARSRSIKFVAAINSSSRGHAESIFMLQLLISSWTLVVLHLVPSA